MTDILFINPPLKSKSRLGEFYSIGSHNPPLNLLYLSAMAEKSGFRAKILDCERFSLGLEEIMENISKIRPSIIGITSMTLSIKTAGLLAGHIKEKEPDIPVIIGGIHLTSFPLKTMQNYPGFDFGVIGEGDLTVVELIKSIKENMDLKNINGIIYRENGALKITDERLFIEDLDELSLPAFHLLPDLARFYRPSFQKFKRFPSTLLVTSRGCPYKCIFCDSLGQKNTYRAYSIPYVLKMIKYLMDDYGIRDINFHDDTFTLNRARTQEFCEAIIKEDLDLTWSCQTRVELVDPELLKLMKRSGCWSVAFGVESGSQKILDLLRKGTKKEEIKQAVKWANEAFLETIGFIVMGAPGETEETMEKTISFVKELNLSYVLPLYFTPFPNSDSFKNIEESGHLKRDWDKYTTFNPVFIPSGLNEKSLRDYKKRIYLDFYLRSKTIIKFFKKLLRGYSFKKILLEGITFIKIVFSKKG